MLKKFTPVCLLINILLSVNCLSQQQPDSAKITKNSANEDYEYKYIYHKKDNYYIHGEPVTPKEYQLYKMKCDSVLKVNRKQLALLQGVYFEEMPTKPALNINGHLLMVKTSNSAKNTALLIYRINVAVDQNKNIVYLSADQAIDKPFIETFSIKLDNYKIENPGAYDFYWRDPDQKTIKLDASFNCKEFSTYINKTVDFSKYRTFAWLMDKSNSKNNLTTNEGLAYEVQNNCNTLFGLRGMRSTSDDPDLLIQLSFDKRKNTDIEMSSSSNSYSSAVPGAGGSSGGRGGGGGRRGGGGGGSKGVDKNTTWDRDTIVHFAREISLKLVDRKLNKLVWASTIYLEQNLNGQFYSDDIKRSVIGNVLESYPAKNVSSADRIKNNVMYTYNEPDETIDEFIFNYQFSYDMGGIRTVSIRKDTAFFETKLGMSSSEVTSRITLINKSDWQDLINSVSGYAFSELVDLPSPTRLRDAQGAYKSILEIKTTRATYSCGYFDGYNPNAKLKKLMEIIQEIEKRP